jgi:hypothetical protein
MVDDEQWLAVTPVGSYNTMETIVLKWFYDTFTGTA